MASADDRGVLERMKILLRSSWSASRVRAESGFTLIELIVTMAIMLVVLTAISATFASGTHSETNASKRIRAESDARAALSRMRDDLHCAFAVQSISQNAVSASNPSGLGFTISLTEYFNTCTSVDQNPGSGSRVFLAWCTVPSGSDPNVFDLYRHNTNCDNTGTLVASHIVKPATGWPAVDPNATGPGGAGVPTSTNGNIWPASPTCQLGYLKTQSVDIAVNPDAINTPANIYELKDQIALRNSTRCGTGSGTLANPGLTVIAPASSQKNLAITPSATLTGSASDTSPITFFYWKQPTAPTDCTTGGTTVGTATTTGDGTYASSLSYTPTTAGDHVWWYATIAADTDNAAATSVCGSGMPMTNVTNGPVSPTLTMSAPISGTKGVAISPASIVATLAGSSGSPTGAITFYWIQQTSAPTTCPGSMTTLGTANPTSDGAWTQGSSFTPSVVGNYWWYAKYAGDVNNNPAQTTCGAGMAGTSVGLNAPSLTISAPATGTFNTLIPLASITATLSGSIGTTNGSVNVYVFGPSVTAPSPCTGGTQVGTAITPSGNGAYHTSAGYTPTTGGTYWWYARYAGDTNNSATNTTCGSSMTSTVVAGPDTFAFAAIGTKTAGTPFNVTITATLSAGGTDTSYTGTKCVTFSGPLNSPLNTAPSYPAVGGCAAGQSSVTFASGVATVSVTLFRAAATTLTATQGAITGTSNSFNVNAAAFAGIILSNITADSSPAMSCSGAVGSRSCSSTGESNGAQTFTATVSLADQYGNIITNAGAAVAIDLSATGNGSVAPTGASVLSIANGATASGSFTLTRIFGNNKTVTLTITEHGTTDKITVVMSS